MAFAIFAGIVAGSSVALHLRWSLVGLFLSVIVGGIVGCLAVDPLQVLKGIAYGRKVSMSFIRSQKLHEVWAEQTQVKLVNVGRGVLNVLAFIAAFLSWFAIITLFISKHGAYIQIKGGSGLAVVLAVMAFFASVFWWDLSVKTSELSKSKLSFASIDWPIELTNMICRKDRSFQFACLFFTLPGISILLALLFLWIVVVVCYGIIIAVKYTFRFIHSEERVQASAYSIAGTATMWWIQASVPVILIGAALGAVLGVILFKFVSVRFIKPATN